MSEPKFKIGERVTFQLDPFHKARDTTRREGVISRYDIANPDLVYIRVAGGGSYQRAVSGKYGPILRVEPPITAVFVDGSGSTVERLDERNAIIEKFSKVPGVKLYGFSTNVYTDVNHCEFAGTNIPAVLANIKNIGYERAIIIVDELGGIGTAYPSDIAQLSENTQLIDFKQALDYDPTEGQMIIGTAPKDTINIARFTTAVDNCAGATPQQRFDFKRLVLNAAQYATDIPANIIVGMVRDWNGGCQDRKEQFLQGLGLTMNVTFVKGDMKVERQNDGSVTVTISGMMRALSKAEGATVSAVLLGDQ